MDAAKILMVNSGLCSKKISGLSGPIAYISWRLHGVMGQPLLISLCGYAFQKAVDSIIGKLLIHVCLLPYLAQVVHQDRSI